MFTTLKIAFRNISRQRKRSILLIGAIAFGMLIITIINALTSGLVDNIRANITYALGGHIFLIGQEFTENEQMILKIREDENLDQLLKENASSILATTKRSQATASLIFGSKQTMYLFHGVDFYGEEGFLDSLLVTDGSLENALINENALILPKPVGERLGVEPGESILVKLTTLTGQQNVGEFLVEAFIEDQELFGLSAAYVQRSYLNELLGMEASDYQMLNIRIKDLERVEELADLFQEALLTPEEREELAAKEEDEPLEVQIEIAGIPIHGFGQEKEIVPWQGTRYQLMHINQIMEPVKLMVGVLNKVGTIVFIILLLVTMVGITNTFRMIMLERAKEIGTMRAFGMHRKQVKHIFLLEALLLGFLGCLVGIFLTSILGFFLGQIQLNVQGGLQLFLDKNRIKFQFSGWSMFFNVALVMLISLLAAYLPAKAAAKMPPIKALGYHS